MDLKRNILIVENPIAGGIDKTEMTSRAILEAEKRGYLPNVYRTTGDKDKEKIKAKIKEIDPSRLITIGGDGTVLLASECIYGTSIKLGMIPGGSANGMAVNFDIPADLESQINVAFSDNIIAMDVVFINKNMSVHISDLGVNAELVKNYENSKIRGKFGYFMQSIPTLIKSDYPFDFKIETEDGVIEESGVMLAITNANKYGSGAIINPVGQIDDELFEVLVFKNFDFVEIFKTLYDKADTDSGFLKVISTKKAKITCATKVPFQIDGEYIGETSSLIAEIGKSKIQLSVPELYFQRLQSLKGSASTSVKGE